MTAPLSPDGAPLLRPFPESRHIPFDLIDANPDQPRRTLEGIEELAQHVKQYGLLQPIVVTAAPKGRFTLVAGQRRLAAMRWLAKHDIYPGRWRDIPAVVRTVEGDERLTLALAENLSRHALSDADVLTALRLLLDLHSWSQGEIARRLGVTRQWISQYARVLADPDLAALVQTGRLSAATAYQVQRAATPTARQAALDAALDGASFTTVRHLAEGCAPAVTGAGEAAEVAEAAGAARSVSPTSDHPATSPPLPPESTPPSPPSSFDTGETESHTVPVSSDLTPVIAAAPAADEGPLVRVRTLAVHALLQEARRSRRPSLAVRTLHATLQRDLDSLAALLLPK